MSHSPYERPPAPAYGTEPDLSDATGSTDDSGVAGTAKEQAAGVKDTAVEQGRAVAGTAKEQAGEVKDTAVEQGQAVLGTAKEQVGQVTAEAKTQVSDLVARGRSELSSQLGTGQQKLAELVHSVAEDLGSMASKSDSSGPVVGLAQTGSRRAGELAHWLQTSEPGEALEQLRGFARRRPAVFLAGSLLAGVVVGRLSRSLAAEAKDAHDASTTPQLTSGGSGERYAGDRYTTGTVPVGSVTAVSGGYETPGYDAAGYEPAGYDAGTSVTSDPYTTSTSTDPYGTGR